MRSPALRNCAGMVAVPAYRGSGEGRPDGVALPPGPMPLMLAGRLLKRWRYIGFYSSELSLCAGAVRVGPFRQSFWAVWYRGPRRLDERTKLGHRGVLMEPGLLRVRDTGVQIDLTLDEGAGVEVVAPYGEGYVWTRKQAAIAARGEVMRPGDRRVIEGQCAFIDDWAGYPPRRTRWEWSAGVGTDIAGRRIAWNLVSGINDRDRGSERTIWIDAQPQEIEAVTFAPGLAGIVFANGDKLAFKREAIRRRRENLLFVRSEYEQPFGTFSGSLPGGIKLQEGFGVMEEHVAVW